LIKPEVDQIPQLFDEFFQGKGENSGWWLGALNDTGGDTSTAVKLSNQLLSIGDRTETSH
jgi:hypothetical protein